MEYCVQLSFSPPGIEIDFESVPEGTFRDKALAGELSTLKSLFTQTLPPPGCDHLVDPILLPKALCKIAAETSSFSERRSRHSGKPFPGCLSNEVSDGAPGRDSPPASSSSMQIHRQVGLG